MRIFLFCIIFLKFFFHGFLDASNSTWWVFNRAGHSHSHFSNYIFVFIWSISCLNNFRQIYFLDCFFRIVFFVLIISYDFRVKKNTFNFRHKLISVARGLSIVFAQGCFYLSIMNLEYATAATLVFSTSTFKSFPNLPGQTLGKRYCLLSGWLTCSSLSPKIT